MSGLEVLTSQILDLAGVEHAFFTRVGGVSEGIYESLNLGLGSKDDPGRVLQNRRRVAERMGTKPESVLIAYQVHSALVVSADAAWEDRPEADGVATGARSLACGVLSADCAPILLADAQARVVAAVHAGWRGALDGVVEAGVARMVELGARADNISAAIGPCIGPSSYEVGLEFLERFEAADTGYGRYFAAGPSDDKRRFDLPAFVLDRLRAVGVSRCEWIGRDTMIEPRLFYSNRRAFKRAEPDYGRLLSAIMLTEPGGGLLGAP
ncbi:MAG: peptidoglycan editing factor PgeF [Phenylobacterium sp.]|uniref:peptidoglycan editing factor PgeF n=1 Tax=Phenylobacterium sp. TaxID=1871053 RepID=UPI0027324761|nr:peptidoglycan editing factor PgeF [Phenylobacterium sp.]MDP3175468.1 peptidoglycan editing factor PgeF [Phenylobacterium sp.]